MENPNIFAFAFAFRSWWLNEWFIARKAWTWLVYLAENCKKSLNITFFFFFFFWKSLNITCLAESHCASFVLRPDNVSVKWGKKLIRHTYTFNLIIELEDILKSESNLLAFHSSWRCCKVSWCYILSACRLPVACWEWCRFWMSLYASPFLHFFFFFFDDALFSLYLYQSKHHI